MALYVYIQIVLKCITQLLFPFLGPVGPLLVDLYVCLSVIVLKYHSSNITVPQQHNSTIAL